MTQELTVKVPPHTSYLSNSLLSSVLGVATKETGKTSVEPEKPDEGNGKDESGVMEVTQITQAMAVAQMSQGMVETQVIQAMVVAQMGQGTVATQVARVMVVV